MTARRITPSPTAPSPTTIPAALDRAADCWPDQLWQRFDGTDLTFRDLKSRVGALMRGLAGMGVGRGTRVGLFLGNCHEWLLVELAVTSLGGWLVPLNTMLKPSELRALAGHSKCEVLVWGSRVLDRDTVDSLREVVGTRAEPGSGRTLPTDTLPSLRSVIGHGPGPWPDWVVPWEEVARHGERTDPQVVAARAAAVSPDDVALVIYTSGTTGSPKGVLQTHGSLNAAISRFARRLGLGPGDRSIFASPLFWIHGCWHQALVPLHCGSGILLDAKFDVPRFLRTIETDGCTHLQGVPTQYEMLLDHHESRRFDLGGLRVVQVGGSTFSPTLLDRLKERAPGATYLAAYGLTEAGVVAYTAPGDPPEDVAATVGHVHAGGDAVVLGEEDDIPVDHGRPGELCLRSDCVMQGYLDDPVQTARALRGGWLHTGDLAVMDERGYIRILGRNQDAYKRGGVTVYAVDVETVLGEHPGVAAAAVVGVADPVLGQVGVAFVVPTDPSSADVGDVLAFCRERLAGYKVPVDVRLLGELPRTASGKVRKFELRAAYEAEVPGAGA